MKLSSLKKRKKEEKTRRQTREERRRGEARCAPQQCPDNGSEWLRTAVTGTVKAHRPLSNWHVILLTRRYE